MKGNPIPFARTFLWLTCEEDGLQKVEQFQGQTLLKAIMLQFQHNHSFICWIDDDFEKGISITEKAEMTLSRLENGDHEIPIIIMDITNSVNPYSKVIDPIIIFPSDSRKHEFDDSFIGYQYVIDAYIKANEEDDQIKFNSLQEAKNEANNLRAIQPENIYRVRNVTIQEDIVTT